MNLIWAASLIFSEFEIEMVVLIKSIALATIKQDEALDFV